jgi:hypothetical protein
MSQTFENWFAVHCDSNGYSDQYADEIREDCQAAFSAALSIQQEADAKNPWLPIERAPKDGTPLYVLYADGAEEDEVYWSDERYCMLGRPQGSRGPGWVSTHAGNLPVSDVTHYKLEAKTSA